MRVDENRVPGAGDERQFPVVTPHPAPGTPHPAPCTRHPAPSTLHPAPGTLSHFPNFAFDTFSASMPGSFLPRMNSSSAPPPVEM